MDIRVQGPGPTTPFLGARDLFETEHDLSLPVYVHLRDNPDERTWAAHYDDHHVLNISHQAASSAMARELALHEFSHMLATNRTTPPTPSRLRKSSTSHSQASPSSGANSHTATRSPTT